MLAVWQRVGGALHLGSLAQRLGQQLAVGAWSGPVLVTPNREHLHGRRASLLDCQDLLAQIRREESHGAEEDHGAHRLGEELQERRVHGDARALPEAQDHDVLPVNAELGNLGLERLHKGAAQQFHIMEHVQVLVLKVMTVTEVERAVHDLGTLEVEVVVGLSSRVCSPGQHQHARCADGAWQVLEHLLFSLGVVTNPDKQRGWRLQVASLHHDWQGALRAHSCHTLIGEQEIEPLALELVALLILFLLSKLCLLRQGLLLFLHALLLRRVLQLLSKSWEDEHHLGVVRSICCPGEGITDGVLTNFVKDGVHHELVTSDQLGDVLHDSHHLLRVGRQSMHPTSNVEASDLSAPCGQQGRGDLQRLRDPVAVHDNLGVLVARLQAVDQLLAGIARSHAVERQLGQHALVAVAPPQQRDGIREDLLRTHGHEPLADALVLCPHGRGRHRAGVSVLPRRLGAVLTSHDVLWRPRQGQHAQRLQLQQLAELQECTARRRQVGRIHEDGVAWLELGPIQLKHNVGRDDSWCEADLFRSELL
mmetsp:Transcript_100940/g.293970  ORF Transcript_100940/g.293970 Transcript_100940/m.293970 type:complete len:536 (+) Transcript_100940:359-1966(+)